MIKNLEYCICMCHTRPNMKHCVSCCVSCSYCGKKINRYHIRQHTRRCSGGLNSNLYYPPLKNMPSIPINNHYGSFGVKRKFSHHCGIDLYANDGDKVSAIESGKVVEIKWFTGEKADPPTPWWNSTRCVSIEGDTGVIVYGEIEERENIKIGETITQGEPLGIVKTVLKKDKGKPKSMLHIQLLEHGFMDSDICSWKHNMEKPKGLCDPTNMLIQCIFLNKEH